MVCPGKRPGTRLSGIKVESWDPKVQISRFSWLGTRGEPLLVENSTFSLCCAQCFKEYMACRDGLAFLSFFRSNTILGPGQIEAA